MITLVPQDWQAKENLEFVFKIWFLTIILISGN